VKISTGGQVFESNFLSTSNGNTTRAVFLGSGTCKENMISARLIHTYIKSAIYASFYAKLSIKGKEIGVFEFTLA
jgi:hypothetical protein